MFYVFFERDNDSFIGDSNKEKESAKILRELADRVEKGDKSGKIFDSNGNSIGIFGIKGKEK